ncbi:hypothetical protein BC829DRAFT_189838 [Chytridium lagenaria]|nr:hypothetical protein BC829DRAFT_189838 [Chytridium lagenaria]
MLLARTTLFRKFKSITFPTTGRAWSGSGRLCRRSGKHKELRGPEVSLSPRTKVDKPTLFVFTTPPGGSLSEYCYIYCSQFPYKAQLTDISNRIGVKTGTSEIIGGFLSRYHSYYFKCSNKSSCRVYTYVQNSLTSSTGLCLIQFSTFFFFESPLPCS